MTLLLLLFTTALLKKMSPFLHIKFYLKFSQLPILAPPPMCNPGSACKTNSQFPEPVRSTYHFLQINSYNYSRETNFNKKAFQ